MNKPQHQTHQFALSNSIADIDQIQLAIDHIESAWRIDEKTLFQLNLILEELISNTLVYGFVDMQHGSVQVELSYDKEYISVLIKDNAIEFDPMEMLATELEFMQRLCEDIKYQYRESKNELHFKIKVN